MQCEKPCFLLIDELDKVDHAFEAILLELLSVWQLRIPKLGNIKARSIPLVCPSIEERRMGDPLRRRSSYLRVEHPAAERETKIVTLRTPGSSHEFHAETAGLVKALRGWILERPSSVSRILDLGLAFKVLGSDKLRRR